MKHTRKEIDACRDAVRERSGGNCELRIEGVCRGRATNFQHRKRKSHCSHEEMWDPANGIDVCGAGNYSGCHAYIHQNPALAVVEGWEVRSWDNPQTRPVRFWNGYVVLDSKGGWTNLGPELPSIWHTAGCAFWVEDLCDCPGVD